MDETRYSNHANALGKSRFNVVNPLALRVNPLVIRIAVMELVAVLVNVRVEAAVLEGALTLPFVEVATWNLPEHGLVLLDQVVFLYSHRVVH